MANDFSTIEQHFRPEEVSFIQQASDWIRQSEDEYRGILTRFLNPREQYILQTLVNRSDNLQVHYNGATSHTENQRAIVAPDFYTVALPDFELAILEIKYPVKFSELHHAMILGAFMNAGIKREVIGDILSDDKKWQVVVDAKMIIYIQQTVQKIGRIKIELIERDVSDTIAVHDDWSEIFLLLSSLRIDTIISTAFNISRSLAKTLIEQQQVRVNWTTIVKSDHIVAVGDIISVRKYGRMQITMCDGFSKKDKIKAIVNIIRR